MNQSTKRILFSVMAVIVLLTACAPAPAPTQDPAQLQDQIEKAVALTLAAQSAEAAQVLTAEPTNTPLPTQTEVVPPTPTLVLPTATPFVIVPPTVAPVISGGGSPAVNAEYSCSAINRKPADNSTLKPNADFDITWTIVNNGKKTMRAGLDVKFLSGPQMTTVTRVELPEIKPGGQYKVVIDAEAPAKEGFHVMTWMVEGQLCYPYIAINVKK